ncbi:MAG TPA: MarR family transcriptional regulator [Anaerolineales bacterium]|nr:MarR family transcriptional regulator [Anaerolineales bacterium]
MPDSAQFEKSLRAFAAVFLRRSVHEFIRSMKDVGLSPSQLQTLMRLHHHGPCPITEVGDDLGVTAAAASQMAERLVQLGLIERSEDVDDRRVKRIRLTPEGRAIVAKGVEARVAWIKGLKRFLDPSEQAQAVAVLARLTEAAQELDASAPVGLETRSRA